MIELSVLELFHHADVMKDTQLTDTHASHVVIDKELIQMTPRNVSQKHVVLALSSWIEAPASNAKPAQLDGNQTNLNLNVLEKSQLAVALKSMTLLDTTVYHAQHTKLLPLEIPDVSQKHAPMPTKLPEPLTLAISVLNVVRAHHQIK